MVLLVKEGILLGIAAPLYLFHLSMCILLIKKFASGHAHIKSNFFALFISTTISDIALFSTSFTAYTLVHVDFLAPLFLNWPPLTYLCYTISSLAYHSQLMGHALQAYNRFEVFRTSFATAKVSSSVALSCQQCQHGTLANGVELYGTAGSGWLPEDYREREEAPK